MGNTAKLKYYWPQSCYELKTNKPCGRGLQSAIVSRRPLRQRRSGSMRPGTACYCCRSAAAARGVWRGAGAAVSEDAAVAALLPMRCKLRRGNGGGGDPCNSSRKNPLLGDIIAIIVCTVDVHRRTAWPQLHCEPKINKMLQKMDKRNFLI